MLVLRLTGYELLWRQLFMIGDLWRTMSMQCAVYEKQKCLLQIFRHWRRTVRMKRFDGLESPRLSFLTIGFCPYDRLPVRSQNQTRARVCQLYPVARRLPNVEEKCPLNCVFMRSGFSADFWRRFAFAAAAGVHLVIT